MSRRINTIRSSYIGRRTRRGIPSRRRLGSGHRPARVGFWGDLPRRWPTLSRGSGRNPETRREVWLHEWLHGVCAHFRELGYPLPDGDADGGDRHGYVQSPETGWTNFYRDLMTGQGDGGMAWPGASRWKHGARVEKISRWGEADGRAMCPKQGPQTIFPRWL